MANPNAPFGLRRARSLGRSNTQCNEYAHAAADSVALFIGDPVKSTGGASTSGVAGIPDGTPYLTVMGDDPGNVNVRGVVESVRATLSNLSLVYCPASVALAILVNDDPYQIFEVMSDGVVSQTDMDKNADLGSGAGGSSYIGLSTYVLEEDSVSTGVLPLRIIRLSPIVGNVLGANAVVDVLINTHELKSTSGN